MIEKDLNSFFKQFRVISDQLYEQSKLKNNQLMREVTYLRLSKAMETGFGLNVTEALTDSFERAYTQQLSQICLSDSLKKVLEQLAKNYQLGIITNGYTQRQELKLAALELSKIIPKENILISEKIGIEKPDRRIFDLMSRRLGIPNSGEILYIGDNYKNDVVGAKQAGWRAWWFNHQQRPMPKKEIADKKIQLFDGLVEELSLLL